MGSLRKTTVSEIHCYSPGRHTVKIIRQARLNLIQTVFSSFLYYLFEIDSVFDPFSFYLDIL